MYKNTTVSVLIVLNSMSHSAFYAHYIYYFFALHISIRWLLISFYRWEDWDTSSLTCPMSHRWKGAKPGLKLRPSSPEYKHIISSPYCIYYLTFCILFSSLLFIFLRHVIPTDPYTNPMKQTGICINAWLRKNQS